MTIASRISRLVPDLSETVARYPACVLAALALCIVANLEAADISRFGSDHVERIYFAGAAAFLAGGAGHLFALARHWSPARSGVTGLGLGAVVAILCYFQAQSGAHPEFALPALVLAVTVAAYLRPGTTQGALWLFNSRLGLAIVLALVITLVVCGGISAILASLEYLFDVRIDGSLYEHTWVTGATLIGPIYGLSLMPVDLDEELVIGDDGNALERGISILINYILVPLVLIYVVILHLYALKIAWTWDLPKGQIGIMVLLFGLGGTATYLIGRPWLQRGTRLLRWFQTAWFWLTIVPVILLAVAVWQRLSDYGVTPERYGLVLVALWLLAMAVYLAARRSRADSRVILATLGILLLIGSFGPWSARDVSVASQLSRLIAIMQANGYLKDGRLVENIPEDGSLPADAASNAVSITGFLRGIGALDQLRPLFAGRPDDPFAEPQRSWALVGEINKQLRLHSASRRLEGRVFVNYHTNGSYLTPVDAAVLISGPHHAHTSTPPPDKAATEGVVAFFREGNLVVQHATRSWQVRTFDLLTEARRLRPAGTTERAPIRIEAAGDGGTAVLLINRLSGQLGPTDAKSVDIGFWALLPPE